MKTIHALTAIFAASLLVLAASAREHTGKEAYLDLMEAAVQAYTPEHIEQYTSDTDREGILEHGYARLTSNIGILLAHGRLDGMKDQFERMMDICIREIPVALHRNGYRGEIGNDFAIKEVISCIKEIEQSGLFPKEKTDAWRDGLRDMKPEDTYTSRPETGDPIPRNWCVFGSASECARVYSGIGGDRSYADKYLGDQLRFFNCDGMYRDHIGSAPIQYDIVTRLQYMLALYLGYDGPHKEAVEQLLMLSAEPTLTMLSSAGEIPFGGRSNQFLHCETSYAAVCEYYASWFHELGDDVMAGRFKAAAARAVDSEWYWLDQKPVRHVKNRYPTETKFGCEYYAHFNKYMVTMASWAYLAFLFADDSIAPATKPEPSTTFVTTPEFHMIFMNAGNYTAQFDTDPDLKYDSPGLGRFQRAGAPPVIALSVPAPTEKEGDYAGYIVDIDDNGPLAIAPCWEKYYIVKTAPGLTVLTDSTSVWSNRLSGRGLVMTLKGKGVQSMTLPALIFDGESSPEVNCNGRTLTITFNGWRCTYRSSGKIVDSGRIYANRNGHLRRYDTSANRRLRIRAKIEKI